MSAHIIIQNLHITDPQEARDKGALHVSVAKGVITLKCPVAPSPEFCLDPREYFEPWGGGIIYVSRTSGFHAVPNVSRDPYKTEFMRSNMGCDPALAVEFGWGATNDEVAIVSFSPTFYAGDARSFDRNDTPTNLISEVIPGYAEHRIPFVAARRELMASLNPFESLAALERQVDLLSQIVFALIPTKRPRKFPAWADELIDIVSSEGADTTADTVETLAKIRATKTAIRAAQRRYKNAKQGK